MTIETTIELTEAQKREIIHQHHVRLGKIMTVKKLASCMKNVKLMHKARRKKAKK